MKAVSQCSRRVRLAGGRPSPRFAARRRVATNPFLRAGRRPAPRARRDGAVPARRDAFRASRAHARFADDPLPMLLDSYERYGPVFTLRIFHGNVVFMLGPEANHYMTGLPRAELLAGARATSAT